MRRRGIIREYFAVKEWNKDHTCQHLHVALRLDYIGYMVARRQWEKVTGAVWIHVDKVSSLKGMASYLGKYLNKAYDDELGKRSYWYSYEWIYRRWRYCSIVMFKLGVPITSCEHELIHSIKEPKQRLDYMNWRLTGATLHAIKEGLYITELIHL